jgi:hypothetical protein
MSVLESDENQEKKRARAQINAILPTVPKYKPVS